MKNLKRIVLLFTATLMFVGCFEDRDDNGILTSDINDFVYKGMRAGYLYKDNIADLDNDRFSSDEDYANYLNSFSNPEDLFESLIYQRQTIDRFSWITDDYIALEQQFNGVSKSNGMSFTLRLVPGSTTSVYGFVRYILPNTNAESQGLKRGDIFYAIDGNALNVDNFNSLLSNDDYAISLGTYNNNGTTQTDDDTIETGTETVSLSKEPYTRNPIFKNEIINVGGENVGYLMYNGFTGTDQFDSELNSVFQNFYNNNITDLVLDLRYNPGGSVRTAIWLSSMITGQFTDQIVTTEQWNSENQAFLEENNPASLENRFVTEMIKRDANNNITFQESVNHINLNKIYILTTGSSASASELVINGLNPYIDVVQIGTTTVGKYQASITLYDSDNFGRQDVNPNHTYAIQPLVLKEINSVGFTDFDNGLVPDIIQEEDISNLGILGDETEPLLALALAEISGSRASINIIEPVDLIGDDNDFIKHSKEMYVNKTLFFNKQN